MLIFWKRSYGCSEFGIEIVDVQESLSSVLTHEVNWQLKNLFSKKL